MFQTFSSLFFFTNFFQVGWHHILNSDVDSVAEEDGRCADDEADAFEDESGREDLPDHQVPTKNGGRKHRGKKSNSLKKVSNFNCFTFVS